MKKLIAIWIASATLLAAQAQLFSPQSINGALWGGFIGTALFTIAVAYLLARLGLGPNISVLPYAEAAIITAIVFPIVRPLYMSSSPSLRTGARR